MAREREESLYGEVEEVEHGQLSMNRKLDKILEQQAEIIALLKAPKAVSLKLILGTPIPQ